MLGLMLQNAANTNHWIEFVGGPFDGHRQPYQSNFARLADDVVWFVTEDAFRQLDRPRPIKPLPSGVLTSAALYEPDVSAEPPNYQYIGSVGPRMLTEAIRNLK